MFTITTEARGEHLTTTLAGESARVEVWPSLGFNCLKWQVRPRGVGGWGDCLYSAPDWAENPVPTRSGHPVLFPFPNRLEGARLDFEGRTYELPRTESTGKHAIHGFTPRRPWRVAAAHAEEGFATLTGAFVIRRDVPDGGRLWPGDGRLLLTYRLTADALRVEAEVTNAGPGGFPFGLGYHPYFKLPHVSEAVDSWPLQANAATLWPLADGLPTGAPVALPPELDFRTPRPVGALNLDHLFGRRHAGGGLAPLATLSPPSGRGTLTVSASGAFRELVLFTPAHRHALAIEPYSCATDAAHLQEQGVDAGWRVLAAGESWRGGVEYAWNPAAVAKPPNAN